MRSRRPPRLLVPSRVLALGLLVGALVPHARTADGAPTHRPVDVLLLEEGPIGGPLAAIDAAGVHLDGRADPIPLDAIRELVPRPDAPGTAAPPAPATAQGVALRVVLRGDEVLRGTLVAGDAGGVDLAVAGLGPVRLVFDLVRRIERDGPTRGPCDDPARQRPPRSGSDVAYAKNGDAFAGTLAGATADGLTLEHPDGKRTVAWGDLVVLHVDEPALPATEGLLAEVETADGTRLPSTAIACDGVTFTLTTRSGLALRVPVAATAAVRFSGGRFVYASDLPFTSVFTPYYADDEVGADFLKVFYGARADRTAKGCPLRVAGTTYRHGIWVHAKSAVTVPLGKRFARFSARFGIDDEALEATVGPRGDVVARVLADGREVWTSGPSVQGGQAPRVVGSVDVTGVDALVLEVDFGGGRHQMDRADWLDPILVRAR